MKPPIPQHLAGLLRPSPVARKNIGPADDNLVVVTELHLDAGDCRAYATGNRIAGIVHGADSSGLGKSVHLKHGNPKHPEIMLSFRSKRSRSADQSLYVVAKQFLSYGRKYQPVSQPLPGR